jgi:hypothetical protein
MGQRIPLPLGKKSSKARSPAESCERLLNAFLETVPEGKEPTPIYGTSGLTAWATGLQGAVRGAVEMAAQAYFVAGNRLYLIDAAGTETELGTVPNADLVSMATDGANVVLTTEGAIYIWNGTTFGIVTDPDAPAAAWVVWSGGYFIFGEVGTQIFFISALADPTNYDALDFASAEWKPDLLVGAFVLRKTLYLGGTKTIEAQQNTGGADFPFTPYQDILIDCGIAGRDAACATNDTAFWLAQDGTARRLDGLTATVISTGPVNDLIAAWSDKSATVTSAHVQGEHLFVVFRNPDGCVVYDQSTDRWHERGSYQLGSWRARVFLDCYGLSLFGSAADGTVYKLDEAAYDEAGEPLEFEIVTPYAYAQNKRLTVSDLEVVAETGVGSVSLDPKMSCEKTRNGRDFGPRKLRSLGKAGERDRRVLFGMQGQGRSMAWRLRITDPVKRAVLGIYAEADVEA